MGIILIVAAVFTIAYQVEAPCDQVCFEKKIQTESNKEKERDDNHWRYEDRGFRDNR
jgi:hypothetical protein